MKVLLDTNLLLDVLLARPPYAEESARVLAAIEAGTVSGAVGATTVTTIFYIAAKAAGVRQARRHVETILSLLEVAPVTGEVLRGALGTGFPDFEDAVLHEAARAVRCQGIVTRDNRGFKRSQLPVYAPREFLAVIDHRGRG